MRISRIQIDNFRNFHHLDLALAQDAVIVGENKIGKSNLIHALRLILDASLPDSARQLRDEDFWDGLPRPLTPDQKVWIAVDLTDFEASDDHVALLADHLIEGEPMTARLNYVFQPLATLEGPPQSESDYEFLIYGGDRPENRLSHAIRRGLPLDVFPALRDAEGDIGNWRRSPLRPLLDEVAAGIDRAELDALAQSISDATEAVTQNSAVKGLVDAINARMTEMVGSAYAIQTMLGFSPTDPDRLLRALRAFIDGGKRGIGDASLGSANLLYLTLKALDFDRLIEAGDRYHTFLCIEEPEAHLHPHLQRLVYRHFLRDRAAAAPDGEGQAGTMTIFLTTHSPHIVSVAPLKSIAVLRKSAAEASTEAASTALLSLDAPTIADLERYLDVTRGELLFAKGVLLVEGEAERFILPALAKAIGLDFDQLGITVCSVAGTNFAPYIALLGDKGLRIPFAVMTDGDPLASGEKLGDKRAVALLEGMVEPGALTTKTEPELLEMGRAKGLFIGDHTLEVDLFSAGAHADLCDTLVELAPGDTAKARAEAWKAAPAGVDRAQLLKDVDVIGKGRFAQRLAGHLTENHCPGYIADAIQHVRSLCS